MLWMDTRVLPSVSTLDDDIIRIHYFRCNTRCFFSASPETVFQHHTCCAPRDSSPILDKMNVLSRRYALAVGPGLFKRILLSVSKQFLIVFVELNPLRTTHRRHIVL